MIKRIVFKDTEKSDIMEQYANDQLAKIEAFLSNERSPIYIDLVFEPSKTREHHQIKLVIKTPRYDKVTNYEYKGTDFYDTLDRVIDTMYKELLEEKRRLDDDKKMVGRHDEFKKQR
ncbi:MAG TPA: HPF/RaiA family ribosome-associated protein [Candidatus Babeliales bacterium]|nr:HPF/RaiA family ribosome-associated protein [Candidatus Babeliales bacterium]